MIVYVKTEQGRVYASPVFAELRSKCILCDEHGKNFFLADFCSFTYFFVDESKQSGWVEKIAKSGFKEILQNKALIKSLKRGGKFSTDGFDCVNLYNYPLPVITEFDIKTSRDIETFDTVCCGLHDAIPEKIEQTEDLIINFDTTWHKHVTIKFFNVTEAKNIDDFSIIFDSDFTVLNGCVKWEITAGLDSHAADIDAGHTYVIAKSVKWQFTID